MSTETTNVTAAPVAEAPKAPPVGLADLFDLAKAGDLSPDVLALLQAGRLAMSGAVPKPKGTAEVYDATFVTTDGEARPALAVKPASAEYLRRKCWITDGEALAIIELAEQVKAIIGKPIEQRRDDRPERDATERKEVAAPASRTPAGKAATKAAKGAAKGKAKGNPAVAGLDLNALATLAKLLGGAK